MSELPDLTYLRNKLDRIDFGGLYTEYEKFKSEYNEHLDSLILLERKMELKKEIKEKIQNKWDHKLVSTYLKKLNLDENNNLSKISLLAVIDLCLNEYVEGFEMDDFMNTLPSPEEVLKELF